MFSQINLLSVLWGLLLSSTAGAQPEEDITKVARRHRLISERATCENGAWSCVGQTLKRCNHDAIIVVGECAAGTICIATGSDTGCQWPSGGPGQAPIVVLPGAPNPATNTAPGAVQPKVTTSSVAAPSLSANLVGNVVDGPPANKGPPPGPAPMKSGTTTIPAVPGATSLGVGGAVTSSGTASVAGAPPAGTGSSAAGAGPSGVPVAGTPPKKAYSAPHYVLYTDLSFIPDEQVWPTVEQLAGVNRFVLGFYITKRGGPFDNALRWTLLSEAVRKQVLDSYHAADIALMVSYGGDSVQPTTEKLDAVKEATDLANYVKMYGFDGVDIDYEDLDSIRLGTGGENWVIAFQTALRLALPKPYLISHAPVAPWFTTGTEWPGGGYTKVHQAVGEGIDFYNVQFYNQSPREPYITCSNIFDKSVSYPGASVFEMIANNIPQEKIVVGKGLQPNSTTNGQFMEHAALGACVKAAGQKSPPWNGGVMFWEYNPANPALSSQAFAAAKG